MVVEDVDALVTVVVVAIEVVVVVRAAVVVLVVVVTLDGFTTKAPPWYTIS